MTISGDYTTPVTVNGFSCKNCTDVDRANKFIDPDKPQDGPFGINARTAPPAANHVSPVAHDAELLAQLHQLQTAPISAPAQAYLSGRSLAPGTLVRISA